MCVTGVTCLMLVGCFPTGFPLLVVVRSPSLLPSQLPGCIASLDPGLVLAAGKYIGSAVAVQRLCGWCEIHVVPLSAATSWRSSCTSQWISIRNSLSVCSRLAASDSTWRLLSVILKMKLQPIATVSLENGWSAKAWWVFTRILHVHVDTWHACPCISNYQDQYLGVIWSILVPTHFSGNRLLFFNEKLFWK